MAREMLLHVLAAAFGVCAVSYIWFVYIYSPLDEAQQRSHLSILQLEQQVRQLRAFQDAFLDLGKREGEIVSDLRTHLAPYSGTNSPDLAKQILQDIDHCVLGLTSCSPAVSVRKKLYLRQVIDLHLTGTFAHILAFLDLIGTHPLLVNLKKGMFVKSSQSLDFNASVAFYTMEVDT